MKIVAPVPGSVTLGALFAERAASTPDSLFAVFPNATRTYGDVASEAQAVAKGLRSLGIKPGFHVAVLMPNVPEFLSAYFGALLAGATVVALNARYKRHELAYVLEHSDAEVLITTDAIAEHVDFVELVSDVFQDLKAQTDPSDLRLAAAPRLRAIAVYGAEVGLPFLSIANLVARGQEVLDETIVEAARAASPEDVAVLMYTSGTTSNPKACALTHAGIAKSWYTFAEIVNLKAGEGVWLPMPFFHTGGIGPMTAIISRGAYFVAQPHFDPEGVVELVEKHRVEHLYSGFPQFSLTVLEHERYSKARFKFIRSMLNVGPPAMQKSIQDSLPEGAVLLNLFGMTEGSGIVTFTPWDSALDIRATTSGKPPSHTEVRIMNPDTGGACAPDEPGEIQFRGGGAFAFYYKDPKATADTIIDGGWVRTGDRGKIDEDGWLYYLGRLKDMLKVGGENVAAAEIEFFLTQHPAVKFVQVIGAPDAKLGEVPVAFVELVPGREVSAKELVSMCDGQLARWKIPRDIVFVTEWPMSSTKVQKFRLRDLLPSKYREAA